MGMRSQLIINIPARKFLLTPPVRIARHSQWVWGEFMITRIAQVVEHLDTTFDRQGHFQFLGEGIAAIYGVNRRTGDTQGLHADYDVSGQSFTEMDNDCGFVVVDVDFQPQDNGRYAGSYRIGILHREELISAPEYLAKYPLQMEDYAAADLERIAAMRNGEWFDSTEAIVAAADKLLFAESA